MYIPRSFIKQTNYTCEDKAIQIKGRSDQNMYIHVYFKSSTTMSYPAAVVVSFYMLVLPITVAPNSFTRIAHSEAHGGSYYYLPVSLQLLQHGYLCHPHHQVRSMGVNKERD